MVGVFKALLPSPGDSKWRAKVETTVLNTQAGILHFIALHKCCVFYKLKAIPSISKKITTRFIVILTLLQSGTKPTSLRYDWVVVSTYKIEIFFSCRIIVAKLLLMAKKLQLIKHIFFQSMVPGPAAPTSPGNS